ncbi:MAG: 16S rRNA (guanine(966)-N(2))-methyltransferase RsmD [Clostridia bacterium]|nr:16S rRNA (guanine(966)-N(2))-methyltransferase RsmD [Clostridia bacterium]MBQ3479987.1 16S rRNA (guanine(966)-N(2))-methyltransferase RsmD [Clostridia bacterium]MBQ6121912.1 16S rRNA (guanine(966)-N(2))-methyltransferase RsmD [Clostridia bacterium]MBQ6324823.1 16S rRNA (guanine(966)-N(2))-methyltransferase RsmD [Clostridia bacterium]
MRIISGEAKGRPLFAPSGAQTRPTSDKIRGALFNIIGARVMDSRVLDLFGGSGALALEALSRGAESAVIADNSRQAWQAIDRNARNVLKDDFELRVHIVNQDYRSTIAALEGRIFDLVFLDPPYRMTEAYGDALARLMKADMLSPGCLIVMERHKGAQIPLPRAVDVFDTRQYGDTAVDFAEIRPAEDGDRHDTL